MPKTSSYMDVAAAFTSQLATLWAGTAVGILRGTKLDRLPVDFYSIGGIEDGSHEIPTMKAGRKARQEEYNLQIEIGAIRGGASVEAAETRALELFDALENMLAADPDLGIGSTVDYSGLVCQMESFDLNAVYDAERSGWRAMMSLRVHVSVRLK